jgi:hypothetical protein
MAPPQSARPFSKEIAQQQCTSDGRFVKPTDADLTIERDGALKGIDGCRFLDRSLGLIQIAVCDVAIKQYRVQPH